MPRFRLSIRWMMVAVALVGVAFGGEEFRRRRASFLFEAEIYGEVESDFAKSAREGSRRCGAWRIGRSSEELREHRAQEEVFQASWRAEAQANATYYRSLRLKYERAARYPWLSVAPDPPAPE
jgi:hypothetical protein